ncbi:MAG: ABC transporter permease [Pseudomonadota bacterium]
MASVPEITLLELALLFVPVLAVVALQWRWRVGAGTTVYATARMLVQLVLVGYVLTWLFATEHAGVIVLMLSGMLAAAAWISLRPVRDRSWGHVLLAGAAISLSGVGLLALVVIVVIDATPWFAPRYTIPLAGMIFANNMNAVSLAAERLSAELGRGEAWALARHRAFEAAFIPLMNSFFAVGLVSLPGMMTGQILGGVEPLVAVRYQIVVMALLLGGSGLSVGGYLWGWKRLRGEGAPSP